jgi:hypothetical protein
MPETMMALRAHARGDHPAVGSTHRVARTYPPKYDVVIDTVGGGVLDASYE